MIRIIRPLGIACAVLLSASLAAAAATPDHLQCFKIKDAAAKASYLATLTPTDLVYPAAAGCTIKVPAKLLCVDAVKSNVSPAPPGADDGLTGQKYLCYKTKCPKSQPTATLVDQFGSHAVEVKSTSMVCAPIPVPATCTDLATNGDETDVDCGGSCPDCANGLACLVAGDCASGVCTGNVCTPAAPTCTDLTQNGAETDIDCGGGTCPDCGPGEGCLAGTDCTTSNCMAGTCQVATCSDGILNGNETGLDCGGGTCVTCPNGQGCALAADCTSNVCSGNVCVAAALADGSPCSSGGQCNSGNCVDTFCCNTACSSTCQACSAVKKGSGANGSCGNIQGGSDPDNECLTSLVSSCGTNGSCSGGPSCALYSGGTTCVVGSCSAGVASNPDQCNGSGTCVDGGTTPCGLYACGASACKTSCSSDLDCATNAFCSAGNCVAKLNDGNACTFNGQCTNGNCVDTVCCGTPCASVCQACTAAKKGSGTDGTCGNIANLTDPDSECAGTQTCNGSGACQP